MQNKKNKQQLESECVILLGIVFISVTTLFKSVNMQDLNPEYISNYTSVFDRFYVCILNN